jgi:DNA-binding MarR family transcriptional regulator
MTDEVHSKSGFLEAGQMVVFWRILHMMISRYGNNPMGQTLVVLTMVFLNDRGMPPTMSQLCEATGLPKATVSRYVSSQIKAGLVEEMIDPDDRRRRLLVQTGKGKAEWKWQVEQLDRIFSETDARMNQSEEDGVRRSAEQLFGSMRTIVKEAEKLGSAGGVAQPEEC